MFLGHTPCESNKILNLTVRSKDKWNTRVRELVGLLDWKKRKGGDVINHPLFLEV